MSRYINPSICRMVVLTLLLGAAQQVSAQAPAPPRRPAERGVGPFTLMTDRGPLTVRLLRREKDLIWVDQLASSGQFFETGIHTGQMVRFDIPRPRIFAAAEQATGTEQIMQMQLALRKISDPLKTFRDLPGIPADEALLLQAQLAERRNQWKEALALYEDILRQAYQPSQAEIANLRAALCYSKLSRHDKVIELLADRAIPDDDLSLLSDLYVARAQACASTNNHDGAIMDYLFLVVFYPFVQTNEARCLSSAIPHYAAITDWDAAHKTLAALQAQYPDTEPAKQAEEALKNFEAELTKEKAFQTPQ